MKTTVTILLILAGAKIFGKACMGEVASGVWPFIIMMLATVFAIYFMPDIAMYIPFKL